MVAFGVRVLLDYRPALRARTGVGEFIHELARALALWDGAARPQIRLFTSSWKDRPAASLAQALPGVEVVDRRAPVRLLSWAWNNHGWPPVETLAGPCDVAHASGPLLLPARRAAQVITIHDLDFLHHPERTTAEIRRDFPRRIHDHARRADHIIVSSRYALGEVAGALDVAAARISVCSPGAPDWTEAVAGRRARTGRGSTILFVGTAEPRKNLGGLLRAYAALAARTPDAPRLVLAGRIPGTAAAQLDALPAGLRARVDVLGYVPAEDKPGLYAAARMLVLPSFEEGFGLPVLEAMACGVPVIVSDRGALPELAGDAAQPVHPDDADGFAARMASLLDDDTADVAAARGRARATRYSWRACAEAVMAAYAAALERRRAR